MNPKYFTARVLMLGGSSEGFKKPSIGLKKNAVELAFIDFPITVIVSSRKEIGTYMEVCGAFAKETTEQLLLDKIMEHCDKFVGGIDYENTKQTLTVACGNTQSEYFLTLKGEFEVMMERFGHWLKPVQIKDMRSV
jgi:hypothetical protein